MQERQSASVCVCERVVKCEQERPREKTERELLEAKHVRVTSGRDNGRVSVFVLCACVTCVLPEAKPVSVTTSHPDQASYRLFVNSHADSFFLLFIYKHTVNKSYITYI